MVGRLECRERHAGIELDAKAYRVDRATARWSDERRDSRSIGDGIGVGRPAWPARDGQRHAGDVAWTDDHREAESEAPRVVPYGVLILDLDRDGRTGRDVGQRRGKDVRPLLLDEARALAFMLGLLVGGLGRGALLDDTVDDPVSDPHAQVIDGGVVGQGEDVYRVRPLVARIRELLAHRCPGHQAGDPQLDVGPDDGRRPRRGVLGGTPEQRALTDAGALCRCRRHRQGGGDDEQQEQRDTSSDRAHRSPPPRCLRAGRSCRGRSHGPRRSPRVRAWRRRG